mmetsp:Transcript_15556/g.35643  ORF Transcript_15556/g.35643 Transcript_15556/m.35643 type:complete len:87 (+) Transcript_15556:104-364(+)
MVYRSLGSRVSDSVAKQNLALAFINAASVPIVSALWPVLWEKVLGCDPEARRWRSLSKYVTLWALFSLTGAFSAIQYIKWHGRPEA